ncbi:hypothetical protein RN001_003117 [Aquatica leii]|uniref:Uncharacterized protein n=1 Tax=Aquatica leii TaxID=1421715 RepID=A0AAN7SDR0_9COLE|nr:hypothetical protein RN001_003117 [Aquatica leii]
MPSYKIVASYLEADELQYELSKRGFTTSCDVKSMRKQLCKILALEKLDKIINYPKNTVIFDDEIKICEDKLNVLKGKIAAFTNLSSRKEFLVLDSRLSHLMCRVDSIDMTNNDEKIKRANLVSQVLEISEQLNCKLKLRKPLGYNDSVSFLISDDSDEDESSEDEKAAAIHEMSLLAIFPELMKTQHKLFLRPNCTTLFSKH